MSRFAVKSTKTDGRTGQVTKRTIASSNELTQALSKMEVYLRNEFKDDTDLSGANAKARVEFSWYEGEGDDERQFKQTIYIEEEVAKYKVNGKSKTIKKKRVPSVRQRLISAMHQLDKRNRVCLRAPKM